MPIPGTCSCNCACSEVSFSVEFNDMRRWSNRNRFSPDPDIRFWSFVDKTLGQGPEAV